jgi:hypothetical protein
LHPTKKQKLTDRGKGVVTIIYFLPANSLSSEIANGTKTFWGRKEKEKRKAQRLRIDWHANENGKDAHLGIPRKSLQVQPEQFEPLAAPAGQAQRSCCHRRLQQRTWVGWESEA